MSPPALHVAERPHDPQTDSGRLTLTPGQRIAAVIVLSACLAILGPADAEPRPDRPTTPERPLPGRVTGA